MEKEQKHQPPFYAKMEGKTLIIEVGNRVIPFPELSMEQGNLVLEVCDYKDSAICLSITFGYGFLYKKGQEGSESAILLDIYPLTLDQGTYGIIKKQPGK